MFQGSVVDTKKQTDLRKLAPYEYSEAGIFSGFMTRLVIQPLDVIKIRFQVVFFYCFKKEYNFFFIYSYKKNL